MKNTAQNFNTQGMRIRATFERTIAGSDWLSPKAHTFSRWLIPTLDEVNQGVAVRAKWTACNSVDGTLEADVYPENVAEVLSMAYKIARTVDFHRVSI